MNNLHRELAPVSDAAWEQIGEEATRTLKRHLPFLTTLAGGLLFMRLIDVNWLIAPSAPGGLHGRWISVPLVVGIGGIWFYVFVAMLRRRPLLARTEELPEEAAQNPTTQTYGGIQGGHGIHPIR